MLIYKINIINFLDRWQTLVGAFLGVILPVLFTFLVYMYNKHKKRKINYAIIENNCVYAISNIALLKDELEVLVERIDSLISELKKDLNGPFIYPETNFPTFESEFFSPLLSIQLNNLYLKNKIALVQKLESHLNLSINELRSRFYTSLEQNYKLVFFTTKDVTKYEQRNILLSKLTSIQEVVQNIYLSKNIPTTISEINRLRLVSLLCIKNPMKFWLLERESWKYFDNKVQFENYKAGLFDRIEDEIEEDHKKELAKMEKKRIEQNQNNP